MSDAICPYCQKSILPGQDSIELTYKGESLKMHGSCFEKRSREIIQHSTSARKRGYDA